jgi:hypothetical protein
MFTLIVELKPPPFGCGGVLQSRALCSDRARYVHPGCDTGRRVASPAAKWSNGELPQSCVRSKAAIAFEMVTPCPPKTRLYARRYSCFAVKH